MCSFFLFGEYCMSIFSHCCGSSNTHEKGEGKKERKSRKQCFKAQPIWLVLPSCLRNVSSCCPFACKGKQELKREVYQTVYLKLWARVGARTSGNPIRHPLCMHSSLELLPGANDVTELLCFQPPPHQTLWEYSGLLLVEFCFWSWGIGQAGWELKVGKKDQRQSIQPSIPQQQRGNGALGLLPSCSCATRIEKAATTKR